MKQTYFTAGPAELYPTIFQHLQTAMDEQIGSISHRSARFRSLYQFCVEQLRELLTIPESHGIFFTGSASEVWERILLNCVEHESFHLVNGSFSKKFCDYATALQKYAHKQEKPFGEGFDYSEIEVPEYAELIAVTHNETQSCQKTDCGRYGVVGTVSRSGFLAHRHGFFLSSESVWSARRFGGVDCQ